ncbi:MAG: hypothetical protein JRM78_01115 [Nitrososphaerota archaeon]|nr:hypothetical protein [Nitrososphaerota archaeon]
MRRRLSELAEHVPLERCRIDERFMMRLDYNVDSLAENIRAYGQLQPGMGYMDNDGYVMVYIGIRRLLAIRRLHELYGAPDSFYVSIVPKPDEASMWGQAISENEERRSISMLDKLNVVGKVPVAVLAGAIDSHIIKRLIEIKKAIGQEGMTDWLHMERMAGGNLTLPQMEALVSHLPDRRSRDVGAFIVVKAHYVTSVALGDNLPRLVANYSLADAPEVAEYLRAHGITKPEPPEIKATRAQGLPPELKGLKASTLKNPQNFMQSVQHAVQHEENTQEAGEKAEEMVEERAEENLPVVLVDPNEKEGQIYACTCGRKVRLVVHVR